MIGIFKLLLKLGAVDTVEYDCLIHNVYGKQLNHGEQKSKRIQVVWDIESSAEHWKYQYVVFASFSFCKVEYKLPYSWHFPIT